MLKKMLLAALAVFLCCSMIVAGAANRGAESLPGQVLEAAYPLWGWAYEYAYWHLKLPLPAVFGEIRGRSLARRAYREGIWHFWGTGMSSTLLVGLLKDDPPIPAAPELLECNLDYTLPPIPEDPEDFERFLEQRRRDPLEHGELVTCNLTNGEVVEFTGSVMPHPCIHEPWLDGFNRKMVELMVADKNWPPKDDHRRLTSFDKFREVME